MDDAAPPSVRAIPAARLSPPARALPAGELAAVFITNTDGTCALRHQRAAPPDEIIIWDYHVVLLLETPERQRWILDLDSRLGMITPADKYLTETFDPEFPQRYRPLFRVVPATVLLSRFSTDRRHMRRDSGGWIHPPPRWSPPQGDQAASAHELPHFLDVADSRYGEPAPDLYEI